LKKLSKMSSPTVAGAVPEGPEPIITVTGLTAGASPVISPSSAHDSHEKALTILGVLPASPTIPASPSPLPQRALPPPSPPPPVRVSVIRQTAEAIHHGSWDANTEWPSVPLPPSGSETHPKKSWMPCDTRTWTSPLGKTTIAYIFYFLVIHPVIRSRVYGSLTVPDESFPETEREERVMFIWMHVQWILLTATIVIWFRLSDERMKLLDLSVWIVCIAIVLLWWTMFKPDSDAAKVQVSRLMFIISTGVLVYVVLRDYYSRNEAKLTGKNARRTEADGRGSSSSLRAVLRGSLLTDSEDELARVKELLLEKVSENSKLRETNRVLTERLVAATGNPALRLKEMLPSTGYQYNKVKRSFPTAQDGLVLTKGHDGLMITKVALKLDTVWEDYVTSPNAARLDESRRDGSRSPPSRVLGTLDIPHYLESGPELSSEVPSAPSVIQGEQSQGESSGPPQPQVIYHPQPSWPGQRVPIALASPAALREIITRTGQPRFALSQLLRGVSDTQTTLSSESTFRLPSSLRQHSV